MKTERTLSVEEIKVLENQLKRLDKNIRFQVLLLIGWTVLAIVIGAAIYDKDTTLYEVIGFVVVYTLIGVWSFLEIYLKQNKRRKNIRFVKSNNKVTSIKVVSTDYIELSEAEDEGVYYFFQLANDKILSFGGQDFYPTEMFPSDNFEIAICYGQKDEIALLEINNYGNKILPKSTIIGDKKWDLLSNSKYLEPNKFTIVDGRLLDLESQLNARQYNSL